MADEIKITGLDELQRNVESLGAKAGAQTLRAALRAGAKVVQTEDATLAPKKSGLLSEHFSISMKKVRGEDFALSAKVGPNNKLVLYPQQGKTAGIKRTAAFITKLLEFGTSKMSKKPFLTQAWESSKTRALNAIITTLRERLGL